MFATIRNFVFLTTAIGLGGLVSCKKSNDSAYNASQPIKVNSFSPAAGPLGTEILIKGSNFTSDTTKIKVSINGIALHVAGANSTEIMAAITEKTGSGPVVVTIQNGKGTSVDTFNYQYSYHVSTLAGTGSSGYSDGVGTNAAFNFNGVRGQLSLDTAGNLYVADGGNQRIRKVAPDGTVSTIAGNGINGYVDGDATSAEFNNPCATWYDVATGNVYVSERNGHNIRIISPQGAVSTYARYTGGNGGNELTSVVVNPNNGHVYWSDFYGSGIYTLKGGAVTQVITHDLPCTMTIDPQGNLYASHYDDEQIYKYTYNSSADSFDGGTVLAGSSHVEGSDDGVGLAATFGRPWGLCIDSKGVLYNSGQGGGDPSNCVRMITPDNWNVITIAGVGNATGNIDGLGGDARFNQPTGITVDKTGNLFVLDMGNNTIRKIVVN